MMTILYNCRHSGDQYRITKFDSDMNPQASYLCSLEECDCPAGLRVTCRHRQMLPKFIARQHVGDEWFLDFDRGGWVQGEAHWAEPKGMQAIDDDGWPNLPKGVTMIVIGYPEGVADVHNAIADTVGEPTDHIDWDTMAEERLGQRPPSPTHIKRRL